MGQLGFFDAERRLAALSEKGDPLEAIAALVPWESLRADIEAVVLTPEEAKKSKAGRCGRSRTGEGPLKGKHLYYRCTDRVLRFPLPPECRERGLNARIADELVWRQLVQLMSSPELMRQQVERRVGVFPIHFYSSR